MRLRHKKTVRLVAAPFSLALILGSAGCGDDTSGSEAGVDVEDIVEDDGPLAFDEAGFLADPTKYVGRTVTVSADVNEVLSRYAFTIAGEDSTLEPLLVVHDQKNLKVKEDRSIKVTGTVRERFEVETVEDDSGFDLGDTRSFESYDREPYIEATSIDKTVAKDE